MCILKNILISILSATVAENFMQIYRNLTKLWKKEKWCLFTKTHRAVKARRKWHNVPEINWPGLVFDKLTNRQAVMHYSRHHLKAFYVLMYTSANDQWGSAAHPLVSSSKTKPREFSSVQLLCSVLSLIVLLINTNTSFNIQKTARHICRTR